MKDSMNDDGSYVKLYRKTLQNEWWDDLNTMRLWFYLLLSVNWVDKKWHGMIIKKGQIMTSAKKLAKGTKISYQSIRTSLERLKSTNQLTCETTHGGTLITIVKWELYQGDSDVANEPTNELPNKKVTSGQRATNEQLTTTKEYKELKNNTNTNTNTIVGKPDIINSAQLVIGYLNHKTYQNYRNSKSSLKHIIARLNEGYTEADCMKVVDIKSAEWLGTDLEKYLRPETLFGNKFEGYLNQKPTQRQKGKAKQQEQDSESSQIDFSCFDVRDE